MPGDWSAVAAGDFNEQNDRDGGIYEGIQWLTAEHIMGRVVGYVLRKALSSASSAGLPAMSYPL